MKKTFLTIILTFIFQMNYSQITSTSVSKPNVKPERIIQYASEIEVYISIQNGIYSTNEIYDLFRGANPKIKLFSVSFGASSKVEVTAVDGVFPSLVNDFQTIVYKVKILKPEKVSYIVACIDEQELLKKDAEILIDFKNESCSGILSKNNILGIENNFAGIYKKYDNTEKGCGYIRINDIEKILKFRIVRIHHGR